MPGTLFLVATPIGNLGDITLRAIETLKAADVVACEDTRRTQQLLNHLSLRKALLRYDEHSHPRALREILGAVESGKSVALVTDAGTPAISDPGARLVQEFVRRGLPVTPIPGPSSLVTALCASGFVGEGFIFLGFLPRREGRAKRLLREALGLGKSIVIFESPFRVDSTLEWLETLAPDAHIVVGRELTKIHEEFLRGTASNVRDQLKRRPQKGEFVLMIEPGTRGETNFDSSQHTGRHRLFRGRTHPTSS